MATPPRPDLRRRWQRRIIALRRIVLHRQVLLYVLAAVVGLIAAYAALGFRLAIGLVQAVVYGSADERLARHAADLPWAHVLLAPCIGGLFVGLLLELAPGKRAQGVPDVIAARALRAGRMRLRIGWWSALISAVSLGVGASAGREGPVVHLGASLGSWLAQSLHLTPLMVRTLLGSGVAAAISASFNAPIAGVLFALEVVLGHYAPRAFAPIVTASIIGAVVVRHHMGDFPAFIVPAYAPAALWEFPLFIVLGALSAAVAIAFMAAVVQAQDSFNRLPLPIWLQPVIGGLLVGALAIAFPEVLGVGYEATDAVLKQAYPLGLLLALLAAKILATAISLGSRFGGGIFSPALFVGATLGGTFGLVVAALAPGGASAHGLYAMVGMGAVAAAVLGAPISTTLIAFELTGDYRVTAALMLAVSMAVLLVQNLLGRSFFQWQLERQGLDLQFGLARLSLRQLTVGELMRTDFARLDADAPWDEVMRHLPAPQTAAPGDAFVVTDAEGALVGIARYADLAALAVEPMRPDDLRARDLARPVEPLVQTETVERALEALARTGEPLLPVVAAGRTRQVLGILSYRDVIETTHRAILAADEEEHGR